MLNAGLNALALARLGGFRIGHGGDGFGWLLIGLVAIGMGIWTISRTERNESAKSRQ
jgi:hypothetical protein